MINSSNMMENTDYLCTDMRYMKFYMFHGVSVINSYRMILGLTKKSIFKWINFKNKYFISESFKRKICTSRVQLPKKVSHPAPDKIKTLTLE